MFMGEYNHTVDPKGRLIIPAKFREQLGDEFVVTKGLDGCLFVYTKEEWHNIEEKFRGISMTSKDARKFSRFFFAGAAALELDKQGRILLPPVLREYADLQKEYGKDGYPQAAIFVKENNNYDELFEAIDQFTNNDYNGLKDYLEKIGIETLSLPSVEITVKSINRQNVHYKKASECSEQIKDFLKLFNIDYNKNMLSS